MTEKKHFDQKPQTEKSWFKKHPVWTAIIGLILFAIVINILTPNKSQSDNFSDKDTLATLNETSQTEQETSEEPEGEETETQTIPQSNYYKVTYVVDGDTLDIDTGERVRLICIDTPERGEYYYSEAKDYLKSLTLNKEVKLEKDISETDRYGRLLRYIYLEDGSFVNELLVENGYAKAYPYSPDTTLCPQIQSAESEAKNNNLGIWAEQQEEEEPEQTGDIICSYNAYNCGDFQTHAEAQNVFDYCKNLGKGDIHQLDRDDDELVCESLP